jgi:hypothetical protein
VIPCLSPRAQAPGVIPPEPAGWGGRCVMRRTWLVHFAVICRRCGVAHVDPGVHSEEQAIEEARCSGWEEGLCPACAEFRLRQQLRLRLEQIAGGDA